ncbi:NUDIX hydrolase [Sporosarcina pasteurii]|uniref:RNA pyrophosphohydrolase n=1 Tax=Sporosarcina pasteurii TaxID=1474 RepID=A0A380C6Y2_SPOPA|nr:NUDIX domain-containing protein [Sporosarcina pasteurii]MDS9473075.1 NUDIX domain-containing protein [Sporosarcina pasteurii]QBQ04580.1 NUDIX domain-containing protein [Sporosarcina pasteurii]SUJ14015.1 RNA pyrophosphohydrolase [Sporosarcina pasteurii]
MGYVEELRSIVGHRPLILCGSGVAVFNGEGEILLVKKFDGKWGIPGGFIELGESAEEAGQREVLEETGIEIGLLELVAVISGQQTYVRLENKDEYYSVTIVYKTKDIIGGTLKPDGVEVEDAKFFSIDRLPGNMNPLFLSMAQQNMLKTREVNTKKAD